MPQITVTEYWLKVQSPEGQVTVRGPFYSQEAMFSARAGWSNRGYKTLVQTRKVQRLVPN